VVPIDKDLARCGEDVGCAALEKRVALVYNERPVEEGQGGLALRRRPVLSASMVRNSSVEVNTGKS
jgi:hypothetical protein